MRARGNTDAWRSRASHSQPLRFARCQQYAPLMTSKQIITTDAAPSSPLFSQGVRLGSWVYISGMVGVNSSTGQIAGTSIEEQTTQSLRNCASVLEAAGCTLRDVAMVTVLLADPMDFVGMNRSYADVFVNPPPARAVARLGPELPGILVSIAMTAHVDD